jgi:hypothetical protein
VTEGGLFVDEDWSAGSSWSCPCKELLGEIFGGCFRVMKAACVLREESLQAICPCDLFCPSSPERAQSVETFLPCLGVRFLSEYVGEFRARRRLLVSHRVAKPPKFGIAPRSYLTSDRLWADWIHRELHRAVDSNHWTKDSWMQVCTDERDSGCHFFF